LEIQAIQLVYVFFYMLVGLAVWKIKNAKIKIAIIVIAILVFSFNPFRLKQNNMSSVEQNFDKIDIKLPKKVIVETESFDSMQLREMEELKKTSEETNNEIN